MLFSTYFRLTYICGLRPIEGRTLKRSDVDLNTGEIRIINSKWNRSRTIVMSDDMCDLARRFAKIRDLKYPESEYFFPTHDGGCYTATQVQSRFKKSYELSRPDIPSELLPAIRVYDLRHRFATAALRPEYVSIMSDVAEIKTQKDDPFSKVDYMTEDAVKALLNEPDITTAIGMRDQFFMILLYDTGGRIQAIINIRINDLKIGKISSVLLHGKGQKDRIVPLMDRTVDHSILKANL